METTLTLNKKKINFVPCNKITVQADKENAIEYLEALSALKANWTKYELIEYVMSWEIIIYFDKEEKDGGLDLQDQALILKVCPNKLIGSKHYHGETPRLSVIFFKQQHSTRTTIIKTTHEYITHDSENGPCFHSKSIEQYEENELFNKCNKKIKFEE